MKFMDHNCWRKKNRKAFCCYVVDLWMANRTGTNKGETFGSWLRLSSIVMYFVANATLM